MFSPCHVVEPLAMLPPTQPMVEQFTVVSAGSASEIVSLSILALYREPPQAPHRSRFFAISSIIALIASGVMLVSPRSNVIFSSLPVNGNGT